MRSPTLRLLLIANVTTFGVYVVASAWGRPFEHDRAAAEAWTWAFSRLAWTPAPLALLAGCLGFVTFVLAQLFGIRPREAFWGALLPYPAILAADLLVRGGHALLPIEFLFHGTYLAVPLAAWIGAKIRVPGQVVEVDGRPITRDGNLRTIEAAVRKAMDDGDAVIVERFGTDQFVQFEVNPPSGVVLDLPRRALDDTQWERALRLLEPRGATIDASVPALRLAMEDDARAAAELALRVFEDVYVTGTVVELVVTTV